MALKVMTSAIRDNSFLETLFAISHTFAMGTTDIRLPFVPIPITTHSFVHVWFRTQAEPLNTGT
jgi:hypothetical protein